MKEYSDKEMEQIRGKIRSWYKDFLGSSYYSKLSIMQKDESWDVIDFFSEYSYSHLGLTTEEWNEKDLRECCLEILPQKITAEISFFETVSPVLNVFFSYLGETKKLNNGYKLAKMVEGLNDEIVENAADSANWGMAKSIAMQAIEEGIDPTDREEMDSFILSLNNNIQDNTSIPQEPHPLQFLPPAPRLDVGVNDPCPCGSGKKYKKCCMHKPKPVPEPEIDNEWLEPIEDVQNADPEDSPFGRLSMMRSIEYLMRDPRSLKRLEENADAMSPGISRIKAVRDKIREKWNLSKVKKMSFLGIVDKMKELNVDFDVGLFKKQAKNFNSAVQLAEERYYPLAGELDVKDEDFIWLALIELWRRYLPEQPNIEMIDDAIQAGYFLTEESNSLVGMEAWEKAWEMIKKIIPSRIRSIDQADSFLYEPLTQSIYNWSGDYEMELYNAGLDNKKYFKTRVKYCREFCRKFPESDESFIYNMLQGEAESWGALGKFQKAEKLFQDLVKKFPDNTWAYAAWGDIYSDDRIYREYDRSNYARAEQIYRLGLERCATDLDALKDRLKELPSSKESRVVINNRRTR